jgi:hypothetical protein
MLAPNPERRPACRQDLESGTGSDDFRDLRSSVEHLFAIVEQKQQLTWA